MWWVGLFVVAAGAAIRSYDVWKNPQVQAIRQTKALESLKNLCRRAGKVIAMLCIYCWKATEVIARGLWVVLKVMLVFIGEVMDSSLERQRSGVTDAGRRQFTAKTKPRSEIPEIGTVVESGGVAAIYDDRGLRIGTCSLNGGTVVGYTSKLITIRRNGVAYTYNCRGHVVGSHSSR